MKRGRLRWRARSTISCLAWSALLVLACVGAAGAETISASSQVATGDAEWDARAQGQVDGRAARAPIDRAIEAYEAAVAADPEALAPRWKLLRALHFAGEFVEQDKADKRRRYEQATDVAERSLEMLAVRAGMDERLDELADDVQALGESIAAAGLALDDVARLYFWSGINWGAWSQTVGLLSAVRQGVAKRLYRYTTVAIALEPDYDEGGPLRLLGSLHAQLPKVPFLTGWVDRDQALPLITRAFDLYPDNPGNQLLLATALLDLAPDRQGEAVGLLQSVATSAPRATMQVEDLAMESQARARRRALDAASR